MSAQLYSVPGQTERRGKAFLEWGKYFTLVEGVISTIIKAFIILLLPEGIGNILEIFKINQ